MMKMCVSIKTGRNSAGNLRSISKKCVMHTNLPERTVFFIIRYFNFFRQRYAPKLYKHFHLEDMPLSVFRAALKKQFTNYSHLNDVRVIDRKIAECRQVNIVYCNFDV